MTRRPRAGIALLAIIAIISLVALLTVATLSVATRLDQSSLLAERDARLDAAASYALSTALTDWRPRAYAAMTIGEWRTATVVVPGTTIPASVTVTRLGAQVFWAISEALAPDGSRRRENLVLRLMTPRVDSIPAIVAAGDVAVSRDLAVVRDSAPGCLQGGADLMIGPSAAFASLGGLPPTLTVERAAAMPDTSLPPYLSRVKPELVLPSGAIVSTPSGIVHASGDLTLNGGAGAGILIVDGRLEIIGPIDFSGILFVRNGIVAMSPGSQVTGLVRVGRSAIAGQNSLRIEHAFTIHRSACILQVVLNSVFTPVVVTGRPWTEVY